MTEIKQTILKVFKKRNSDLTQLYRNRPFQFVLALHHPQERNAGIDTRCPLHNFLPFLDAPLSLPDLQRRHAYLSVNNVSIFLAYAPYSIKKVHLQYLICICPPAATENQLADFH